MASFVTTAYKTREDDTVAKPLGILLVTAAQTPTPAMTHVSDVTAEVTGADYARHKTSTWGGKRVVGDTIVFDWVDGTGADAGPLASPLFQVGDVSEIAGAWTYLIPDGITDDGTHDAVLELVAYTAVPVGAGTANWPLQRTDGYGRIGDGALTVVAAGTASGAWIDCTVPSPLLTQDIFDADRPVLQVRHSAAADQVDLRGDIGAATSDAVTLLGAAEIPGVLVFEDVIPAGYRPVKKGKLAGALVIVDVESSTTTKVVLPADVEVTPSGGLVVTTGTVLGDGVTDLATYLDAFEGSSPALLINLTGSYALTT